MMWCVNAARTRGLFAIARLRGGARALDGESIARSWFQLSWLNCLSEVAVTVELVFYDGVRATFPLRPALGAGRRRASISPRAAHQRHSQHAGRPRRARWLVLGEGSPACD